MSLVCKSCNSENSNNTKICSNCGMPLYNATEKLEEERIDGYLVSDIIDYIGSNAKSYIEKFKAIESKKFSWSWVGFIFPQLWFAYRKMNKWSALSLVVFIIPMSIMTAIYKTAKTNPIFSANMFLGLAIFLFVYNITMGLYANKIYMLKVFDQMGDRGLKGRDPSTNNELKIYLSGKGNPKVTNVVFVMFITIIFNFIIQNLIKGT
jgi:hypothetical protein